MLKIIYVTLITFLDVAFSYFCKVNIHLKIYAHLFMFVLLMGILKQSFFFGYYITFTENFIENFCENKDKPELKCDGKCFLGDLIDRNNSDSVEIPPYLENQIVLFFEDIPINHFAFSVTSNTLFNYFNNYQFSYTSFNFKPPNAYI
jgi:hypothetical protein